MQSQSNHDDVSPENIEKTRGAVTGLANVLRQSALEAADDKKEREELANSVSGWLKILDEKRDTVADEAKLQWHLAMLDLKERVSAFDSSFNDLKNELRAKAEGAAESTDARAKLDRARVQAHLAKMESEAAVEERRKKMAASWAKEKAAASRTVDDIVETIQGWTSKSSD